MRAARRSAATCRGAQTACAARAGAGARQLRRSSPSQAGGKEMSTTMAFVRMLGNLLKDPALGPRIVPIVADEARTFGMANLFKQVGIYSSVGQTLRAGGHRLGAVATARRWTARSWKRASARPAPSPAGRRRPPATACTALPMLPFYIYYSMFGFQRVGDAIWAAADQRARGFLLGATVGPHHAGRRGPAAPGRQQPPGGRDHPQLQGLRPGLRRRDGGDRRSRHARDAGASSRTSSITSR